MGYNLVTALMGGKISINKIVCARFGGKENEENFRKIKAHVEGSR